MKTASAAASLVTEDHRPVARTFIEKIGRTEYQIEEARLNVLDDVTLWSKNPRLQPFVGSGEIASETELEAFLRQTRGYDALAKSIAELGQMEPVYVWKAPDAEKYLILEGATRVAILRELARRHQNQPTAGKYNFVKAKVLPPQFDESARVILLAKIHVRGTGVRQWGRYIEAKFVFENTWADNGQPGLMSVSELAEYMEKSVSWVSRLREAYRFGQKFVEHIDSDDAERLAVEHFSTLEEIAKCTGFGPKVREYGNAASDQLRAEVFDMVRKDVFKEYRDARYMKHFHDDADKWGQLQTGERHIANKLANEISAGGTTLKVRIEQLDQQITKALEREADALDDSDVDHLRKALRTAEARVHVGVRPVQIALSTFQHELENASLEDVRAVSRDQFEKVQVAMTDFRVRAEKHGVGWNSNA